MEYKKTKSISVHAAEYHEYGHHYLKNGDL